MPVALGLVHAHLRLARIEDLRRLSQGRVAEDPSGRSASNWMARCGCSTSAARCRRSSTRWRSSRRASAEFLRGVTHVVATAPPPPEFALLGVAGRALEPV